MKIKEEKITLLHDGVVRTENVLNEEVPTAVFYIENTDFAKQKAAGLSKEENYIEAMKRSVVAFFETAFNSLDDLEDLDPEAAAELRELYIADDDEDEPEEPEEPEPLRVYHVSEHYCTAARFTGSTK